MTKSFKILYISLLLLLNPIVFYAQQVKGLPKIINFYDADNPLTADQIWDIKQSPEGFLYLASNNYFIKFDGLEFTSLFNDFNTHYLSFAQDTTLKNLYLGGKNSISISKFTSKGYKKEQIEVPIPINYCWKTFYTNGDIYFFINKTDVLKYSTTSIELIQRPTDFEINRGFYTDSTMYAVSVNGVAEIKGSNFNLLNFGDSKFYSEDIRAILNFSNDSILVATKVGNLYLVNKTNHNVIPFKHEDKQHLLNSQIYNGTTLNDTSFIITTLKDGIFIFSKSGKILGHFNTNNGLASNDIYVAYVDNYKNIWLGTGKGLIEIQWGQPIRYIDKGLGINSGVQNFYIFNNKILISTYDGIFYQDLSLNILHNSLKPIKNSVQYSNDIISPNSYKNDYVITAGYSKIQILNNKLDTVYNRKSKFKTKIITESPIIPNRFFVGTSTGLFVHNFSANSKHITFEKIKEFFDLSFNIDDIFFDKNNDLWVIHSNSIFLLDFDNNESLKNYKEFYFDNKKGLSNNTIISIFENKDSLYIASKEGIYVLCNRDLTPDKYFFSPTNNLFLKTIITEPIIAVAKTNKNIYLLGYDRVYKTNNNYNNYSKIKFKTTFEIFNSGLSFYKDKLILNSKDKVIIIDTCSFAKNQQFKSNIVLESFSINDNKFYTNSNDSIITLKNNIYTFTPSIDSNNVNISLKFFAPYFNHTTDIFYKFFIVEESTSWETFNDNTLLLRHLSPGNYKILIKATNFYDAESKPITVVFIIRKPFFQSTVAFILYALLIIIIISLLIYIFNKRVRIKNKSLEEIVAKRTVLLEEQKEELAVQSKELQNQKKLLEREKDRLQIAVLELKQLSLVAQKTNNSVLIIESNGKFEWWNRVFTELFAFKIEKYSSLPLKLAHKKIRPDVYKEISSYTEDKGTISYTNHEVFDNGEEIWYQTTINPVTVDELEHSKFVVIDYNITSIKNNEIEIQKLQEQIRYTKNRLNKAIADLKLKREEHSNIQYFDKKNLEYAKLLKKITIIENNVQFKNIHHWVLDTPQTELSGDFLWIRRLNKNEIIIAIGDATGHRIRGTINSVMTISYLHDIYSANNQATNEEVFTALDEKLSNAFSLLDTIKGRDHLNLAIIKFNVATKTLCFTSSRIPLFLIRKEFDYTHYRFDGDRIDIGLHTNKKFSTHKIELKNKDRIYLSTDGWSNQFGKFGLKKYSNSKIRDFLLSIQEHKIEEHRKLVNDEISNWKGNFEQTDDILIFGAEITF